MLTGEDALLHIPARSVILSVSIFPLFGLFSCVWIATFFHFDEANRTGCNVPNFLPSISAAVGQSEPERYIWRCSIALHLTPRLIGAWAHRNFVLNSPRVRRHDFPMHPASYRFFCNAVFTMHAVEILSLMMLTFVSSTDNFEIHAGSFCMFVILSLLYMPVSMALLRLSGRLDSSTSCQKSYKMKRYFYASNLVTLLVTFYLYHRHNKYCEPYVYSFFALGEYIAVITNIGFHACTAVEMTGNWVVVFTQTMSFTDDDAGGGGDICRVCRMESAPDRPLYYPCLCTGSIKYIHQECLVQWLKYSKKELCELCNHRYTFQPIYHPDMPRRLPLGDLMLGVFKRLTHGLRAWFHYTLVLVAWLGVVPLSACRIYRCLFTGSVQSWLTLPLDMLSADHLFTDCFYGVMIILASLGAFMSLVWLREQMQHHNGVPDWMNDAVVPEEVQGEAEQAPAHAEHNEHDDPVLPQDLVAEVYDSSASEETVSDVESEEFEPAGDNADALHAAEPNEDAAEAAPAGDWNQVLPDAAEDLNWQRVLGLDGTFVFLEHVFWVIALNTLFLVVFAFAPYHIGYYSAISSGMVQLGENSPLEQFERLLITVVGYVVCAVILYLCNFVLRLVGCPPKVPHLLGLAYLVVKVFLLILLDVGVFPLLCGWWLDICSLRLFGSSLSDRITSFYAAPGTTMFVHWLVGMVFVFYFASFILLVREVVRPGLLWFLRNLNDPDFNPIHEMLVQPVVRHSRRFLLSVTTFGCMIVLLLYAPVQILLYCLPTLLPYRIHLSINTPLSELMFELLLLQVVLPTLLEQSQARDALKYCVKIWCAMVGKVLGLTNYLLPNPDPATNTQAGDAPAGAAPEPEIVNEPAELPPVQPANQEDNLAAQHEALILLPGAAPSQPYSRPSAFGLRILLLLATLAVSALIWSVLMLSIPVSVGRFAIRILPIIGDSFSHELYTLACGLFIIWLFFRAAIAVKQWANSGMWPMLIIVGGYMMFGIRCIAAAAGLLFAIPTLVGVLFEVIVVVPVRVEANQTAIIFIIQDWAMGIVLCKIACALIMMGPNNWWLREELQALYNAGLANFQLRQVYGNIVVPLLVILGTCLAAPYALSRLLIPLFSYSYEVEIAFIRHIYPFVLVCGSVAGFLCWQINLLQRLMTHIRDDKYLMGQQLINYVNNKSKESSSDSAFSS